jgi:hypothetical protein
MSRKMRKGEKEAKVGVKSERAIVKFINRKGRFRRQFIQCLKNLGIPMQGKISAKRNNKKKYTKTDIFIEGGSLRIGVSIKSSTKTSFHHLDRRRLEKWKKDLGMPEEIFKILKKAILRVAKNPKNYFIRSEKEREIIREFLARNIRKIINEIFTQRERELQLLLINDIKNSTLYLFRMKDVINFLIRDIENNITFSSKGIIKLGNFITAQRKGGDSSKIRSPKTRWEHPGNQLQFKFSPLKFVNHMKKYNCLNFQSIKIRCVKKCLF